MVDISNIESIKSVLRQIDKPWIASLWVTSLQNNPTSPFGNYIKMINSLPQYKGMSSADVVDDVSTDKIEEAQQCIDTGIKDSTTRIKFELTDEIVDRWGIGYQPEEYEAFERKYALLKNNYPEKTAMHTEALLNYIRYRVKEELATAAGTASEAKTWGQLAQAAATAAKINPSQLSAADLQGGLNSFGELIKAVETAVDIIPILPQFKFRPNDALDFIMWCYINYIRDLRGMPACEYSEVYEFYDKRKQEYIEQYGDPYNIFTNDTTEENRENIKKFIQMPKNISGDKE